MGCGSSTEGFPSKSSRLKKDLIDSKTEKMQDSLTVSNDNYPRPRPPRDKKAHIYTPGGYSELEENARRADFSICVTWHAFVKYLTQGMRTDIEKVRSLFVWMGHQNFKSGNIPSSKKDTPLAYMVKVKKKTMSYAAFFVKICRAVGLKAVVIQGIAKSVAYDVGDTYKEVQKLRNNWCAVHVNGDWRIIFPLWAFSAVEDGGLSTRSEKASKGSTVRKFNEFFFLTDPDIFIHFCFPDDIDWQLLTVPVQIDRFLNEPFYRQPYFKHKLHCPTLLPGIHFAKHGVFELNMRSTAENWPGELNYQLFFNKKESTNMKLPSNIQLLRYVLMEKNNGNWKFVVRFPVNGVFKLTINGGIPPYDKEWICDLKLICETADEDVQPLPCNVGAVGWGPGNTLTKSGIIEPSHAQGTILARLRQQVHVCFKLTKKLFVRTELVANKYKVGDLKDSIEHRIANQELVITVTVPEDGEYALRMFAKEKKSSPEENVCNYLITTDDPRGHRTFRRENAFEKNLRRELVTKAQDTKDPDELEKIIEKFDKLALEDKGDLKKAKNRRDFLRLRKELVDATDRKHFGTLDSAIKRAKDSKYVGQLKETIKKAQILRDELYSAWIHDILEMKQTTVAELKCYRDPTPSIVATMRAVYLLLGEDVETWDEIHFLLSQLGKDSLIRRIKDFKTTFISPGSLNEAEHLIKNHDLDNIRQNSPAAGAFYIWVRDLVDMIKNERKSPKRKNKKEASNSSNITRSSKKS